jgi:mannosyltransferase OCH1-like enzyme
MIPKKIHIFWFGRGEKSEIIQKCMATWKEFAPDYEVIEWNEDNFDVNFCKRSKQAYEQKKWAFVADIARLKIIYEHGGMYFDTDVRMLNSLNEFFDKLGDVSAYFMSHNERYIGTGYGFGAEKGSAVITHLLDRYMNMDFELKTGIFAEVCTQIETDEIEKFYPTFIRNNKTQRFDDGTVVLSTGDWCDYFDHIGTGTWVDGGRTYTEERLCEKNKKIKSFFRNPKFFKFIRKTFGKKAERIYEFLTYDLPDMGIRYFVKRLFGKLKRKR